MYILKHGGRRRETEAGPAVFLRNENGQEAALGKGGHEIGGIGTLAVERLPVLTREVRTQPAHRLADLGKGRLGLHGHMGPRSVRMPERQQATGWRRIRVGSSPAARRRVPWALCSTLAKTPDRHEVVSLGPSELLHPIGDSTRSGSGRPGDTVYTVTIYVFGHPNESYPTTGLYAIVPHTARHGFSGPNECNLAAAIRGSLTEPAARYGAGRGVALTDWALFYI